MKRNRPLLKHALLGFGAGVAVGVLFFPLNIILAVVLLFLLLVRIFGCQPGERMPHLMAGGICVATVIISVVLPVKQLDREVGPFRYEAMSLDDLCRALRKDHRVVVNADRWVSTNLVDSFVTDRAMSRRQVLQKLAQETGCELQIGYCGTGATFLFGAHPSFTRLRAKTAPPGSGENQNLPDSR
jgi:hypothetical protein